MSLATWLHGIIQGTKSPAKNGNMGTSEGRCESKEPASSGRIPTVEDEVFAERLLGQAVALIGELEANSVPYAVVGGTAVLMQAQNAGLANFRGTYDIDILVNDQRHFAVLAAKPSECEQGVLCVDPYLNLDLMAASPDARYILEQRAALAECLFIDEMPEDQLREFIDHVRVC